MLDFGMISFVSDCKTPLLLFFLLCGSLLSSAQQHAVWLDAVPVTRRLFGSEAEADVHLTMGWSSALNNNGWRALIGGAASGTTDNNFGTTVVTKNRDVALRTGYRWFSKSDSENPPRCRPVWGADALFDRRQIGTESSSLDFNSTFKTVRSAWGLAGVIGADLMLAPKIHLIIETRLDAMYRVETEIQEDSFGGRFEQSNRSWESRLDPPLSLFVVLAL